MKSEEGLQRKESFYCLPTMRGAVEYIDGYNVSDCNIIVF